MLTPAPGSIQVICGPMFSGKTEELISRLQRARKAGQRVAVFKPSMADRYSQSEIVSHNKRSMLSESVDSAGEIWQRLDGDAVQVIGIDEANFFGSALVEIANRVARHGKRVILAGLDLDYLGRPFAPIPVLAAMAESVNRLQALCAQCGAPAPYTQRLTKSEELILVGAVDSYEARCISCFEPCFAEPQLHFSSAPRDTSALN